jgi:MFS family permease
MQSDSGRQLSSRTALLAVAYAFAVTMIGTTMPTPLYPIYQRHIHFSALMVTVVYAAYGVGVLLALLLLGPLSDRYGRRRILIPGLAAAAVSSIVFLLAQSLPVLLVGRVISGLSAGVFTGTATAALIDLTPEELRPRATLIATAVNTGGLGLGPLIAGALAQFVPDPLRVPYALHLALLIPAIALVALIPDTGAKQDAPLRLARLGVPPEVRATFIRSGAAAFAAFATMGLFSAVAPAFLAKLLGLPSHLLSGAVVFALFAASTVGQLSLGRFSTRHALAVGCAIMIVGMASIAGGLAASSLALLLIGANVGGFGTGLSFRAGLAAVNAEAPPNRRGELNSSFFVVAYLALSIPIVGVGVATKALGLRDAGLVFSACVVALALAVLLGQTGAALSSGHRARRPGRPRSEATEGSTGSR